MRFLYSLILSFFCISLFFSCQQDLTFTSDSNAVLAFSSDTVQFDTVFTTIGSTTKSFRFHNQNENAVKTTISLSGGDNSNFRLNIDGVKATSITDFEIMGNDSIYVFVEVTVDPQNSNSPLVIEDSINFFTNGNQQDVKLVAYGQDVHLYNDSVIKTQNWINDKPYLIYNSVLIDSLETLTIEAGVQLHFHENSSMIVGGTLKSNGTLEEPIVFQGDRLEQDFDQIPGQWGFHNQDSEYGALLFLPGSMENVMNYTTIKNARLGLQILYSQSISNGSCLKFSNSNIQNMSLLGMFSVTSNVDVSNSVFSDCGMQAMLLIGGNTTFYHSTIANFFPSRYGSRDLTSIEIRNYSIDTVGDIFVYPTFAMFGNSIIDGSLEDEILISEYSTSEVSSGIVFDHCMLKLSDTFNISKDDIYKDIIKISSPDSLPRYVNKDDYDYRLDTLSAAKDKGKLEFATMFPYDADGISRLDDIAPDLGPFERIEAIEPEE